ncbi:MAG: hypothetical protein K9K67_15290 [Bacteriovoracaceae bacterium]|nr:hypothetical protein [Bacteriovoracaceae bacterium]
MNLLSSLIFIICLTTFSLSLRAGNLLTSKVGIGDTTDKINYRDFHLTANKNELDLLWPYLNEEDSKDSFKLDFYHRYQKGPTFKFKYNEFQTQYSHIFKKLHQASIQGGFYAIDEVNTESIGIKSSGKLNLLSKFNENFYTSLFVGRGLAIREIFLTGRNLHDLRATSVGVTLQHQFLNQRIAAKIIYNKHFLSNGIERNYFDSEVMASLMKYPHWVRIGFGYHTMDYNKFTTNYWSPTDFYAFGPRLDLSYVFNDKLQAYFGGNYNWFEENKIYSGTGYYLRTGLRYGIREDFTADLSYERNESVQNNNSWVGKSVIINLTLFL